MSRSICLALVVSLSLAGHNLAYGQNTQPGDPDAGPSSSSAPAGDDVASLKAENAGLKKEIADAKRTIAQLQAKLAQAQLAAQAGSRPAIASPAATSDVSTVTGNNAPFPNAAPAGPLKALPLDATNVVAHPAAPAGPLKALPLDATNAAANPSAPATDAGPSRSYTVVKGDSLWKIAHKMYPGDTKNGVDKIQEANKDAIGGKPLKIGQVLIIPQ